MKYFALRCFSMIFRVNKAEILMEKFLELSSLQNFSQWSISSKL